MPPDSNLPYSKTQMPQKFRVGEERRFAVCDKGNPDALIYQVWIEFAEKILELDQRMPEVWSFTEAKLERWVKPTQMLRQLRAVFWSHVYRNRQLQIPIRQEHILVGFLSHATFFEIIKVDANLAFLVRPPSRLESLFESLLYQGCKQLMDVIREPMEKKIGKSKRNHIINILMIIRECERKLCRDQSKLFGIRMKRRKEIFKELTKDGVLINAAPPAPRPEEDFNYNEFEELAWEGDEDDGEIDRSASGNRALDESEEGLSRGEEEVPDKDG